MLRHQFELQMVQLLLVGEFETVELSLDVVLVLPHLGQIVAERLVLDIELRVHLCLGLDHGLKLLNVLGLKPQLVFMSKLLAFEHSIFKTHLVGHLNHFLLKNLDFKSKVFIS